MRFTPTRIFIICIYIMTLGTISLNDICSDTELLSEYLKNYTDTSLLLRCRKLTSLPITIGEPKQLRYLCLYENQLKSIPKEIENLEQLCSLDLSYNQLESLPVTIRKLQKLVRLSIWGNLRFVEYEEEDETFGWQDLRDIFGDTVLYFDQKCCIGPSEDGVYVP